MYSYVCKEKMRREMRLRKDETRDETNLWYNTNSLSQTAHVNVPNVLTVDENTP